MPIENKIYLILSIYLMGGTYILNTLNTIKKSPLPRGRV